MPENEPARDYGLGRLAGGRRIEAPRLPYRPRDPDGYRPGIGLIGCGGISEQHLQAYRAAGYAVVALCSRARENAEARRRAFFPGAAVHTDYGELLARDDVAVVDVATHADVRPPILEASIRAGKHVLSQKPFTLDLDDGRRLADLADERGVRLAVNQNGRWAPHFSWMRAAVERSLLGPVASADFTVLWDHGWTAGTPFDAAPHLLLFDFGIHWFDLLTALFAGRPARRVSASVERTPTQANRQPLLARAVVEFDRGRATLAFNGDSRHLQVDATALVGARAAVVSTGPDLQAQSLTWHTAEGHADVPLEGRWFPDGFHGAMAELLCAIAERREPAHSGRRNLDTLALCFAACASAADGAPRAPGEVRRLP